jgi:methyl-accepting chemotaxis protein
VGETATAAVKARAPAADARGSSQPVQETSFVLSAFNNLRLAVRLGVAFGALVIGLAVVALVGSSAMGELQQRTDELAERALRAAEVAGGLNERSQTIARVTAQHLYVHDGDLRTQDGLQQRAIQLGAQNTKASEELATLLEGTLAEQALTDLTAARTKYADAWKRALELSREETAREDAEREGSRTLFVEQVAPLSDEVAEAAHTLGDQVGELGKRAVAEADASGAAGKRLMLLVALVAGALAIALAVLTTRSVTRPVKAIADGMESLNAHCLTDLAAGLRGVADGDLTVDVRSQTRQLPVGSKDELGRLSETFNAMLANAQEGIGAYGAMRGQLGDLVGQLTTSAGTVSSASEQLNATSEETSKAVTEIATAIGDVAQGAETQVQRVNEARSAISEAVSAVMSSAQAAEEASGVAEQARETAQQGVQAVGLATDAMSAVQANSQETANAIAELAAKSHRIGEFIETITGISEQTNLLALNAAIEAARAGEQGRGFAVVAEEVRKLAEESQVAATTISALVQEIQSETERTVRVVEDGVRRTEQGAGTVAEARAAFEAIDSAVGDMTARIEQIAAAAEQITATTERVSEDIVGVANVAESSSATAEEVSASTQETSASAEEISASAQELSSTAHVLEQLIGRFKVRG